VLSFSLQMGVSAHAQKCPEIGASGLQVFQVLAALEKEAG
jgi:hypothetical protein